MVVRTLAALGVFGVQGILIMPDSVGIAGGVIRAVQAHRALSPDPWPAVCILEQTIERLANDTRRAVRLMVNRGVRLIIVLGGDGTHRVVAAECRDIPLVTLSTGTNNAFPDFREATSAGMAAGLCAMEKLDLSKVCRRNKRLNVGIGDREEIALVDVGICSTRHVGTKALWSVENLAEVFVTFSNRDSTGLSSIPGLLRPTSRDDGEGAVVRFDGTDPAYWLYAPIAVGETEPGQIASAPESVTVNGRQISYLRRGETGDSVLLVHGFGGDKNNWLFNHESLASTAVVYALDLPGHGGSDKKIEDTTLGGLAKVVLAFADSLGLKEFHLVGHSVGGAISLSAALESPNRIKSVTVISSAGLGKEIDAQYLRGFAATNSRKELKNLAQRLFAKEELVTRQLVEDLLRFKRLDGVQSALEAILSSFLDGDSQRTVLTQKIPTLGVPIRAIWGEKDRIIPAAHAASVGKDIHILPDAGHMVQMEAANEVNKL